VDGQAPSFTSPLRKTCLSLLGPGRVRAKAYDLVLNGRRWAGEPADYRREVQSQLFQTLGIGPEEAKEKFGFLLEALEFGAPPHGESPSALTG